jgi:hypothetical protein
VGVIFMLLLSVCPYDKITYDILNIYIYICCSFVGLYNKRVSHITINYTNMALCSEQKYCVLHRSAMEALPPTSLVEAQPAQMAIDRAIGHTITKCTCITNVLR